jgi:flagellar biosynthesis protein FliR
VIDLAILFTEQLQGMFWPAVLCFLRIGAAVAILPGIGESGIPARVRLALALALTVIVLPLHPALATEDATILAAGAEVLTGLLLGLALRLMILGLQTAAAIAAQTMSLAQLFATAGAEPQPALGTLFTMAAIALAFEAGLHVKLSALFILSYDLVPVGRFAPTPDMLSWGSGAVSTATALAFSLALPFVIIGMLWNIALGAVNRAMPQLMVAFIGAPALALGSLVLAALFAPLILMIWVAEFDLVLSSPFAVE